MKKRKLVNYHILKGVVCISDAHMRWMAGHEGSIYSAISLTASWRLWFRTKPLREGELYFEKEKAV